MPTNPIDRIDMQLQQLAREYRTIVKNNAILPPKAAKLIARIRELEEEKTRLLQQQRTTLRRALPEDDKVRGEVYLALLKLPIIADFLYDATLGLRSLLSRHGINELSLTDQVKQLKAISARLALTLDEFPATSELLSKDDTLIDALHKKVDSFLLRRMEEADKQHNDE